MKWLIDAFRITESCISFFAPIYVVIRTIGGNVTIDAEKDTVSHYGTAGQVTVKNVAAHSFHEFGQVSTLSVENGNVVIEDSAVVSFLASSGTATCTNNGKVEAANIELTGATKVGTINVNSEADFENEGGSNGYYVLAKDIALTKFVEIMPGKTVILDLNGKNVVAGAELEYKGTSYKNLALFIVHYGGNLIVNDSKGAGTIDANNKEYAAIQMVAQESWWADGETEDVPAKLTVNGGTLIGQWYGAVGNGSRHNTEIVINGGKLTGQGQGIYHPQDGILTINGGEFVGGESGVEIRSGKVTINGGYFKSTATAYKCAPNNSGTTTEGAALAIVQHNTKKTISVVIYGGVFEGIKHIVMEDAQENGTSNVSLAIYGGTFDDDKVGKGENADNWTIYNYRDYLED